MGRKKLFAFFCTLVYMVVFAHSVIPHDHHHHCIGEQAEEAEHHASEHPHHGSCEMLDLFLVKDALTHDEIVFCLGEILPSEPLSLKVQDSEIPAESIEAEEALSYNAPPLIHSGLRAPPVA